MSDYDSLIAKHDEALTQFLAAQDDVFDFVLGTLGDNQPTRGGTAQFINQRRSLLKDHIHLMIQSVSAPNQNSDRTQEQATTA